MPLQKFTAAAFRVEKSHLRRGAMFLVNIGAPVVFAAATGHGATALLGGIAALTLSFADTDKGLPARLLILAGAAVSMALCGTLGYLLEGKPALFWPVFVLLAFGVGMSARGGRELLMAVRYGAVAFTAAAGLPIFDFFDAKLLTATVSLIAVSRIADHLLFGPLPRSATPPQPQRPSSHLGWVRFALAYAAAAAGSLWIGLTLDPSRAVWVVTTTLIVMQADARSSYQRIVERILGTFAGVLAAWGFASAISQKWALLAVAVIAAPFIPHHVGQRYWLHTALIALFILLMYGYAEPTISALDTLLRERLKDMLMGCAVAVAGTAVAFPRTAETSTGDDGGET
jgi:uncharacterized membrane protein YccC